MVRLTITPRILEAINFIHDAGTSAQSNEPRAEANEKTASVGDPISHTQISELSKRLRDMVEKDAHGGLQRMSLFHLDDLLRGSRVYVEPPPPRAEPVCRQTSALTGPN